MKKISPLTLASLTLPAGALALLVTPSQQIHSEIEVHSASTPAVNFKDITCKAPESIEIPALEPMSWWAPDPRFWGFFCP